MKNEVESIRERYARRGQSAPAAYYALASEVACMMRQEKERALLRWIRHAGLEPLSSKRVLEIGCGYGQNLLDFLRLGFRPENLAGNELLPDRARSARELLPAALCIHEGNALDLEIPASSFHVVYQSTVFTSILDGEFQQRLARRMWDWVLPGGGVLWYDFVYDNPRNPDVKGVPLRRIRRLFPEGRIRSWRVTLAPPLARLLTRVHPSLYTLFNAAPFLRTHVLCWIQKP